MPTQKSEQKAGAASLIKCGRDMGRALVSRAQRSCGVPGTVSVPTRTPELPACGARDLGFGIVGTAPGTV